ncbi:MAG TPA: redoxin domain-containing protein [Tepidisphaeraceae bacterium]|nr:redoxin domain-containing protein [Tepidisphaeraceae bacterium]
MQITFGNPAVGDMLRDIELPTTSGEEFKLARYSGKSFVLLFCPFETESTCHAVYAAFRDGYAELQSKPIAVLAVTIGPVERLKAFAEQDKIPFPVLCDAKLASSALYGALRPPADPSQTDVNASSLQAACRAFLVGPDSRIVRVFDAIEPSQIVGQVLNEYELRIAREAPRQIINHAPVLLIPNVLPPKLCQRLIQIWDEKGNEDSGFMKQVDGKTVGAYDYSHKIRRDHFMANEEELAYVKRFVGNRVGPIIRMAFNYEVTRYEDFRIACYDSARGGYFRPHRDNTTDGTAHRRFAMSLLLNDDYGGGTLRFPEYGLHEYRPDAGSAVVFSCSLLHEATDVTAGRRFVLLSFFYGEKEAKIREEYSKKVGSEYRA